MSNSKILSNATPAANPSSAKATKNLTTFEDVMQGFRASRSSDRLGQDSSAAQESPTQLFLNHDRVFAGYKKEQLNVGNLVTTADCRKAKLILDWQTVKDFNSSKVSCPNARNPVIEKKLWIEIIATAEDKYNKYRYKKE
uniref:Uncharacterized protein n=1 Tax=Cannabis sativa TaxID=3483 RepID=A0A803Q867_CANSA